jgi:tetratricopeptide (TPR) repeat protein
MLLLTSKSFSQQPLNTQYVDQQTYTFLLEHKWDNLVILGKQALSQGIDFYYLRYRLGIAYFEKSNFHKALTHLYKAYDANPHDPTLKEYLYYANLIINRKQEARLIAETMTSSHRKNLGITSDLWIESIGIIYNRGEGDSSEHTNGTMFELDPALNGEQFISQNHSFIGVYLSHPVSSGFSVYHGYAHTRKEHYYYSQSDGFIYSDPSGTSNLHQYYISGIMRIARNLNLVAGTHYINIRYPIEVLVTRGANTFIGTETVSVNNYVGFASLYKHLPGFTLGGTVQYAGLNQGKQLQTDAKLAWYPTGNLNLYTVSTLSLQIERNHKIPQTHKMVFYQQVGGKITKNIWLELSGSIGDMKNFLRNDAVIVYNAMDMVKQQAGASLTLSLSKHVIANTRYTFSQNESVFNTSLPSGTALNKINYNSHSFTGGLAWIF